MPDNWETLAALSGIAAYAVHEIGHAGLYQEIPVTSETASVGVIVALASVLGVYINAKVHES